MSFLEKNRFSASALAFLAPALSWCGAEGKLETHGGRRAAKATAEGRPWSLSTGLELRESGWKKAEDFPKDSIWIIEEESADGLIRTKIGDDRGKWLDALRATMKGAYNGGIRYGTWVSKRRSAWSKVMTGITVGAAVVVSVVATPAAGALVLAAGAAASAGIASGDPMDAVEAAAASGALEALAAETGVDPAAVDAVYDLAAAVDPADNAPAGEPETGDLPPEQPDPTAYDRIRAVVFDAGAYARENPERIIGGIIGGILLRRFL